MIAMADEWGIQVIDYARNVAALGEMKASGSLTV
jgi:hypothetical protein